MKTVERNSTLSILLTACLSVLGEAGSAQFGVGNVIRCDIYNKAAVSQSSQTGPGFDNFDQFGRSVAFIGDLNGDGVEDAVVGAQGDDGAGPPPMSGGLNRGAFWVLLLNADGSILESHRVSEGTLGLTLDDADDFGKTVAGIGDFDGDGYPDVAVAAPNDDNGAKQNTGAIYFFFLQDPSAGSGVAKHFFKLDDPLLSAAGVPLDANDEFGRSLVWLGDVDQDGDQELVVGATGDATPGGLGNEHGAIHFLQLTYDGPSQSVLIQGTNRVNDTEGNSQGGGLPINRNAYRFGVSATSMGDADGDGSFYLAVGTQQNITGGPINGSLFVLRIRKQSSGDFEVEDFVELDQTTPGLVGVLAQGDIFAYSVASVGDLDLNGFPDVAVGSLKDDAGLNNVGAVTLVFLDPGASALVDVSGTQKISLLEGNLGPAGCAGGFGMGDGIGSALAWAECFDDTGAGALLVGTRFFGGSSEGLAQLLSLERTQLPATTVANGTGINPLWLSEVAPAIIGKPWMTKVDTQGTPFVSTFLYLSSAPFSAILSSGEVLIDPSLLLVSPPPSSATGDIVFDIPLDASLVDQLVYSQALVTGTPTGLQLTNSLITTIGDFTF